MNEKEFFTGSHNPADIVRSIDYDIRFYRQNPDYFEPNGIWCYCGVQGSGKTLSMVQTLLALHAAYPQAIICSNLDIKGLDYIPFIDYSQISELTNGIKGVIFVLDEIQTIWNCVESRDIPLTELATLCQNRKDRRVVLCTSQVYGRVAKPIREQYKYVVLCHNIFKYIQINSVVDPIAEDYTTEDDGHFQGKIIKRSIFFHSPAAYEVYDTLNKIDRLKRGEKSKSKERRFV